MLSWQPGVLRGRLRDPVGRDRNEIWSQAGQTWNSCFTTSMLVALGKLLDFSEPHFVHCLCSSFMEAGDAGNH